MIRSHPFTLRHHFFLKILITCWGVASLFVTTPIPAAGEQSSTSTLKVTPTATNSPTNTINGELDLNSQKAKNNTYFNVHKFSGQAGRNIIIERDVQLILSQEHRTVMVPNQKDDLTRHKQCEPRVCDLNDWSNATYL